MIRRRHWLGLIASVLSISALAHAQEAKPAVVYVDDLDITKAIQGYGTPGKNISAESNPVTLKGKTFDHAFGTHADGTFVIDLKGSAKSFSSIVGVDDDTSGAGSVRFYVIGDGKLLAESGILRGGSDPKTLTCDLTGVKQLVLRCDVAADGDDNDHADWADSKIILDPAATDKPVAVAAEKAVPELFKFIDELDLSMVQQAHGQAGADTSIGRHPMKLDGKTFPHGYGTTSGKLVLDVKGNAKTFSALVGIDDDAGDTGAARFIVIGDGKVLAKTDVIHRKDKPQMLTVDITGVKQLVLKVQDTAGGNANDHADWANARIDQDPAKAKEWPETIDATLEKQEIQEAAK